MKRRRILHCIPGMGGGGAERQLAYLAGGLKSRGWDVHVALRSGGPNLARLERSGATVHKLTGLGNHDPTLIIQLFTLVRRLEADLIQVWLLQMEVAAGVAATLAGVPWILSERSSDLAYPRTWKHRLRLRVASRAAAIAANSDEGGRYWAAQPGAPILRRVIPNAVPCAEISAAPAADPRALGWSPEAVIVMCAGRLNGEKNVPIMLDAISRVLDRRREAVALIAGDGPMRQHVDAFGRAHGLGERLALPGYLPEPWPWMKRADVFVSVSRFEGHPNTVLEAAACGTPLVLSDIPAHRAMFDDRSALFAPADDAGAIAAAVHAALSDRDAAGRRAAEARRRLDGTDIPQMAASYHLLYERVLGAAPGHLHDSRSDPGNSRLEDARREGE